MHNMITFTTKNGFKKTLYIKDIIIYLFRSGLQVQKHEQMGRVTFCDP